MRILIVEDTDDSRVVFKTMIESLGHEVLEADAAKVAIRIAAHNRPDFVLMDLRMPGCDGLIGTGALRAIHGLESVPIVAITAHYSSQTRAGAIAAGCNDCIAKPITRVELAAVIAKHTSNTSGRLREISQRSRFMEITRANFEDPIHLAGRTLKRTRHVCGFFNSSDEQNKVLMPFFKEGMDRGEKIFHIVDARLREDHLRACREAGLDVDEALNRGQFEVCHWEDAYLKDGYFDADRMLRTVEEALQAGHKKYKLTRLMGNMEWALETAPGVTDIVEYEAKLNYILPKYPDPAVCVYDLKRHSGTVVMDILRTHPMVIIAGVLQDNPLYVPPDEFLQELKQRKSGRTEQQRAAG